MRTKGEAVDAAIRLEALNVENSYIVQAPAGSGKTELLTQRILTLLGEVDEPEEILAITFTRKAAAEMRIRVLNAIEAAASKAVPLDDAPHKRFTRELGSKVLERSRERGWELLRIPGRLRIQTIDSLCASLLQQMPLEAGFGATADVIESEETRRQMCSLAALNTVKLLLSGGPQQAEAMTCLLLHLDNNLGTLRALLSEMLARRDQWERHISGQDRVLLRERLEGALRDIVRAALRNACDNAPSEFASHIVRLAKVAESNLRTEGRENPLAGCRGIDCLPGPEIEDLAGWQAIRAFLLTKDGDWRKARGINARIGLPPSCQKEKEGLIPLLETLAQDHENFRQALLSIGEDALPGTRFADSQWQVLDALLTVLPVAIGELKKIFRAEGVTDFVEIAQGALRATEEGSDPSAIRKIKHLLVDEFQDTSVSQFQLLSTMVKDWRPGDGRTLFLVGDPMQSIYRFRQAEVGLFLRVKDNGIANLRPISLALKVNFRSDAALVDWFNARFERVFGTSDDAARGAVSFNSASPGPTKPDGSEPAVHWTETAEEEAERTMELVRSARSGQTAILVRSRNHLPSIVAALRRENIPFEAVEIQKLGDVPVVQDLLMLTRALLHPADRLAWIAVLRAPWCGLTLADLHALCSDTKRVILDCLRDLDCLSEDGRKRAARVLDVLSSAIDERRRKPLREWVEGVWLSLGGPACLSDEVDLENAAAFLELLDGIEQAGDVEIADLSARVQGLFAKAAVGGDAAVKVMTIHKAKGLEFDRVILPGLGRRTQTDSARLLLWEERASEFGTQLLLAPITQKGADTKDPIYRYVQRAEAARREEEDKRLLYVAVTRARRELHLVATPTLTENGELRQNGSLLRFLWDDLRDDYFETRGELSIAAAGAVEEQSAARMPRLLRRLASDWNLPPAPESVQLASAHVDPHTSGEAPVSYDWVSEKLRHVGIVVHSMIQRIARDGLQRWPASRISQSSAIYRAALSERGLAGDDLEQSVRQVEQALLALISDERGRWTVEQHEQAQSELAISGVIENDRIEHVKLDRTFIDQNGTRWIIDFKTSRHEGSDLTAFLDNEQTRHREQLQRYAKLMRQLDPDRPIRVGLYFPLLRGWREWQADVSSKAIGSSSD